MNEQEYRKAEGQNYSALSEFYKSQDHALLPSQHKAIYDFGHVYETLLRDICQSTGEMEEKYFICDVSGAMPDDLCRLIHSGSDLEKEIIYNADGKTRNGHHKTRHAFIDSCLGNPGRYPVTQKDIDLMNRMAENCLKAEIEGFKVFDILSKCEWQVPVFWEREGIKKKGLLDCLWNVDGVSYCIDIKTSANESQFRSMLYQKYWIQALHYGEGTDDHYGNFGGFYFLASYKDETALTRPWNIDFDESKFETYKKLCEDYEIWRKLGKPEKGYLPLKTVKM